MEWMVSEQKVQLRFTLPDGSKEVNQIDEGWRFTQEEKVQIRESLKGCKKPWAALMTS
jgi:hypothetical protein